MKSEIILCGFGGQGVIFAGELLGRAGIIDGLEVAQSASYGAEARGSACHAGVVLAAEPISYPKVRQPDILVAMSQDGYGKFIGSVKPGGRVLFDCDLVAADKSPTKRGDLDQVGYPATAAATELERQRVANVVMCGIVAGVTGIVGRAALETAVREQSPPDFIAINLKALKVGWELGGV